MTPDSKPPRLTELKSEFVSPHPLEECVRRLSAKNEPRHLISKYERRLYVKVEQMGADAYRFHVQEIHNLAKEPGGIGEGDLYRLLGVMSRAPDGRTSVAVKVVPDEMRLIVSLGGLLLLVVFVGAFIISRLAWPTNALVGLLGLLLVILGAIVFPQSWRTRMERMMAMLRETLDA